MRQNKTLLFGIFLVFPWNLSWYRSDQQATQPAPAEQLSPVDKIPSDSPPTPSLQSEAQPPRDFAWDARLLLRVAACTGDMELPQGLDKKIVDAHCKQLLPQIQKYQKQYAQDAAAFLANLQPPALPSKVVYSFGGGDLVSALTCFPKATEFTTISLELAGDPRRIEGITRARLLRGLQVVRPMMVALVSQDNFSHSTALSAAQHADLPTQLSFFLLGLAVHGYEPVSLRYFSLLPDGSVHYLTETEVAAQDKLRARHLKTSWAQPDFSVAFSNSELSFKKAGDPSAPIIVHRHIAANLSNAAFSKNIALQNYLSGRGQVVSMIKAASYLLWDNAFSGIRDYLLKNASFMYTDSSGIPPRQAQDAGFSLETYGTFTNSYLKASTEINKQFRAAWQAQPKRALAFRFGYPDGSGKNHMIVYRKALPSETSNEAANDPAASNTPPTVNDTPMPADKPESKPEDNAPQPNSPAPPKIESESNEGEAKAVAPSP